MATEAQRIARYATSFPLLVTDSTAHYSESIVTQGHADYCRDYGHATHTKDGNVAPWCPRCGDKI